MICRHKNCVNDQRNNLKSLLYAILTRATNILDVSIVFFENNLPLCAQSGQEQSVLDW